MGKNSLPSSGKSVILFLSDSSWQGRERLKACLFCFRHFATGFRDIFQKEKRQKKTGGEVTLREY
jgi:hypothetical protein